VSESLENAWVVDTGATSHICNDLKLMHDIHVYEIPKPLGLAAGQEKAVRRAQGKVWLSDGNGGRFCLTKVEYVPTATENLLSVSAAVEDGLMFYTSSKGEHVAAQSMAADFTCGIQSLNNLYYLVTVASERVVACISKKSEDYDLWHKRLGHTGIVNMERLHKEHMVEGLDGVSKEGNHDDLHCDACIRRKQTRTPSIPSPATTSRPLELLHLDVVGELPVDGSGGERYFLTVLDDFSHRCEGRVCAPRQRWVG
jgi:hypothetical protein